MTTPQPVRSQACPACGHEPSAPRGDNALRRLLHLRSATTGCGWVDTQIGMRIAVCSCRNAWHGDTVGPGPR